MASRAALVVLAAALLAGCGGRSPHMARSDAAPLISLAHAVRSEGACAQARDIRRLQQKAVALVNARRVPASMQDSLMSGVNALSAQTPVCLPAAPVVTPTPAGGGEGDQRPGPGGGKDHHGKHKGHGD